MRRIVIPTTAKVGDAVTVVDAANAIVARGLSNYSRDEVEKIRGRKSRDFAALLGLDTWYEEVIHRDDLVLAR